MSFSVNLKNLRIVHNLSAGQLADILGLKNKASITHFELGLSAPSYEVLIKLSNLFAVSLDWLVGRSPAPYKLEIIEQLENNLAEISKTSNINLRKNIDLIYFFYVAHFIFKTDYFEPIPHSDYANTPERLAQYHSVIRVKRNFMYSLEHRANVIYALNFWLYASKRLHNEGYDSQVICLEDALKKVFHTPDAEENDDHSITAKINQVIDALKATSSSKRAGTSFALLCYETIDVLQETIRHGTNVKLHYDIKKAAAEE